MIKSVLSSLLLSLFLVGSPSSAQTLEGAQPHSCSGRGTPVSDLELRTFTPGNRSAGFDTITASSRRPQTGLWLTKKESQKRFPGFAVEADSPYQLRFGNSGPIVGTGVGLLGTAALTRPNKTLLKAEEISRFNREDVNELDRGATRLSSSYAGKLSDFMVVTSVSVPFLYLTKERSRKDFGRIVLMQFETGLVTTGLIAITKVIINRPRPFVYNPDALLENKLTPNANQSFFSGHTATVAAMSFFTATTFSQYYPESKWKVAVWTYAATLPAVTGYLRYRAGVHYPTDIITGYVVGAAVGMLVPKIHQKVFRSKNTPLPVH